MPLNLTKGRAQSVFCRILLCFGVFVFWKQFKPSNNLLSKHINLTDTHQRPNGVVRVGNAKCRMQFRLLQRRTAVVNDLCGNAERGRYIAARLNKSLISIQLRSVPDLNKIEQLTADLELLCLGLIGLALLGFRRQRVQ